MTDRTPLYVRLPLEAAELLDRAAFETKTSKQDLVTDMIRRFTVETTDDGMAVGHAAFRPFSPPDVLTVAELASWLQVDDDAVTELAEQGDLLPLPYPAQLKFVDSARPCWTGSRSDS